MMKVIVDIGKVRVYRMNVKVIPLFPFEADINFSRRWPPLKTPKFSLTETHAHRFLGKQSLQIKKNYKKNALIFSPLVYSIPSQSGSFVLYAYAGKYQQKSVAALLGGETKIYRAFSLNYLFGVYREEGKNLAWEWIHPFFMLRHSKHKELFKWQIFFVLNPLNAGLNKIQETLLLREQTSYFDGMHGYLLAPIVEK